MYHIFFTQSSVDGHLGCFYSLSIVNNTSVDTGVHISYISGVFFPLDKYPEVELLDHIIVLFLIFWGTSILFSIVAMPIYISTNSERGFPFIHILANTCYLLNVYLIRRYILYSEYKISIYICKLYLINYVVCLLYPYYFWSVLYRMC